MTCHTVTMQCNAVMLCAVSYHCAVCCVLCSVCCVLCNRQWVIRLYGSGVGYTGGIRAYRLQSLDRDRRMKRRKDGKRRKKMERRRDGQSISLLSTVYSLPVSQHTEGNRSGQLPDHNFRIVTPCS